MLTFYSSGDENDDDSDDDESSSSDCDESIMTIGSQFSKSSLIVHGYFTRNKCILDESKSDLFKSIPQLIIDTCVLYFFATHDSFDKDCASPNVELYGDNDNILKLMPFIGEHIRNPNPSAFKRMSFPNSSFGLLEVSSLNQSLHVKWILRVQRETNEKFEFAIGIARKNEYFNEKLLKSLFYLKQPAYAFCISEGECQKMGNSKAEDYGNVNDIKHNSNEIVDICVELNLKTKEISFAFNGINQGVAFENIEIGKKIKYSLAVSLLYPFQTMTLISFDHKNVK